MRQVHSDTELRVAGLEPLDWESGRPLEQVAGRGSVRLVDTRLGTAVIRHYRRGGKLAALLADRYWYRGAASTRCFREFHVLSRLQQLGLPACRPLAARFLRSGLLWYRADLATLLIPHSQSLHQVLRSEGLRVEIASAVGQMIARFHAAGLWHADLNAHNILRDDVGRWWLIDLDRARFRSAGGWQQQNLRRLERSWRKLGHLNQPGVELQTMFLHSFHTAYAEQLSAQASIPA